MYRRNECISFESNELQGLYDQNAYVQRDDTLVYTTQRIYSHIKFRQSNTKKNCRVNFE